MIRRTHKDGELRRRQFLTRFDIPDRADPSVTYLTRWRIVQTPWFAIYLHRIRLPDSDANLHDHPWPFISVILLGGYVEERPSGIRTRGALSIGYRRATDLHRILSLMRAPTWTLLLVGRRVRRWGFDTENGWVNYVTYLGLNKDPDSEADA